ncbi:MAG: DUF4837 family protein [Candidatus Krumholzibacteriota bacterium]|nr:DUF4837 family protein [Candidatus Krumholzibacteriota bacterium]
MKRSICLILIILSAALSCGRRTVFPPAGSYSDVVLVTETGERGELNDIIIRQLQHQIDYYSKVEVQFKIRLISAAEFSKEPPTKNMVVFGVARQGRIGGIIENFIGTNSVRTVLEGKNHIFKKLDYPTLGQLTVIVTASSAEKLKKVARENGEIIRDIIEEANRQRLRDYLLERERTEVTRQLNTRYGFTIRVPYLYKLNQDKGDIPGIELVRVEPHRGLTISWRTWKKSTLSPADSTELYDIRANIAWKMYDKDVMRKDLVFYHLDQLGPYAAVRMEGYWENSQDLFGGPFMCFFVYDRAKTRVWMIDCVVYAPGFDKHKLLRELRAVAETFRVN